MTKLIWHKDAAVPYEFGVDRGVFYSAKGPPDIYDYGVVWNGLISVEETSDGGEASSYHFDGIKYLDIVAPRNYKATLTAYSCPNQASIAVGDKPAIPGFILTRQSRDLFGLSYRTFIGADLGYKIHLVYNILATPVSRAYSTKNETGEPETFSWKLDAFPTEGLAYRPSAHYILDSTKMNPDALIALEMIIHGTDSSTARLPTIGELLGIIANWNPLLIGPQTIPGIAELISGSGDLTSTTRPEFYQLLPQTRLNKTPVDGIYRLE